MRKIILSIGMLILFTGCAGVSVATTMGFLSTAVDVGIKVGGVAHKIRDKNEEHNISEHLEKLVREESK